MTQRGSGQPRTVTGARHPTPNRAAGWPDSNPRTPASCCDTGEMA